MRFIGKTIGGMQTSISNDGLIYVVSDDLYIENVTQDKDIIFKTNDGGTATEVMRIDGSTSNVGIGTSSPANKLDVVSTGTYAARFRGPSATYVQSGESTLSGETGFLARNSTGAFYLGVAGGVPRRLGGCLGDWILGGPWGSWSSPGGPWGLFGHSGNL